MIKFKDCSLHIKQQSLTHIFTWDYYELVNKFGSHLYTRNVRENMHEFNFLIVLLKYIKQKIHKILLWICEKYEMKN